MSREVDVNCPQWFSFDCTTVKFWKLDFSCAGDLSCMLDDSGKYFLVFFSKNVVPRCNVWCDVWFNEWLIYCSASWGETCTVRPFCRPCLYFVCITGCGQCQYPGTQRHHPVPPPAPPAWVTVSDVVKSQLFPKQKASWSAALEIVLF